MLARDIERRAWRANPPKGGRDVDDAAAFLRRHHAQLVLQAEQDTEDVGIESRCVGFERLPGDRAGRAFGSCVVDGDIEAPKSRNGAVYKAAHIVLVTNVGLNKLRFGGERAYFLCEFRALRGPATGYHQPGSLTGEGQRSGSANASERSGDEDNLSVLIEGGHKLLWAVGS